MIIGIGGVSRSGKTSLAFLIKKLFEAVGETAIVLSQDDFAFPESEIPLIKNRIDWECPASIDFEKYKKAILKAQHDNQHVITEGLLNFYDEDLIGLFDYKFFTQISENTFMHRRMQEVRWGYEPKWYLRYVWKSYKRYGRTIFENSFTNILILSGEKQFPEDLVKRYLNIPLSIKP